jgi:hypothetical protein
MQALLRRGLLFVALAEAPVNGCDEAMRYNRLWSATVGCERVRSEVTAVSLPSGGSPVTNMTGEATMMMACSRLPKVRAMPI